MAHLGPERCHLSSFDLAVPIILAFEGTPTNFWVDDPDDLGGETVWGISALIIKRARLVPEDLGLSGPTFWKEPLEEWVKADTIRSMWAFPGCLKKASLDCIKRVYKQIFWKYDNIENQKIATKLMDVAVNCGEGTSHRLAQKAANSCGQTLVVDGVFGPKTMAAINACDAKAWMTAMCAEQANYYREIVVLRPRNGKFLAHWLRRSAWGL